MLIFSGLRGAMAFALAMRNTSTHAKKILMSTTLGVVLITVFVFGGTTMTLLKRLRIRCVAFNEYKKKCSLIAIATQSQCPRRRRR
jgi:NhaP-type Na+/H+ or K+/H+ antiporter